MCNYPNPPQQYNKRQTRAEEIEKCLVLEQTSHFSVLSLGAKLPQTLLQPLLAKLSILGSNPFKSAKH